MSKLSKEKGKRGEREVIHLLQPVVTEIYEAHCLEVPILERNLMQSRFGGYDIVGLEWLALEVKYHAAITPGKLREWWQQTLDQAGATKHPVLIYRQNGGAWKVMMRGTLSSPGNIGWQQINVPCTVDIDAFTRWFRVHLNYMLHKLGER